MRNKQGAKRHAVVRRLRFRKAIMRMAILTPFEIRRVTECANGLLAIGVRE